MTYSLGGHLSGVSIIFPLPTYFRTSSLESPWYGWAASVAISHNTTPYDLQLNIYRNDPKFSATPKICCNHSKIWPMWLYHRVMSPNDADANSVDPDQTAPLGAVWSGSALSAQAYLSENLGSLR